MTLFVCQDLSELLLAILLRFPPLPLAVGLLMWFGNEYLHEYLDEKINWTKHPLKGLHRDIGAIDLIP